MRDIRVAAAQFEHGDGDRDGNLSRIDARAAWAAPSPGATGRNRPGWKQD